LATLTRLAEKLVEKKQEVSKLKRQSQRELEKAKSLRRKSSSGLAIIEKRIGSAREQLSGVSEDLIRRLAQQESIQRLLAAAEEKLGREKQAKEQTEQEIEFAESPVEKENAEARLRSITDRIEEIIFEMKQRKKMIPKVTDAVEDYKKSKSKISTKIQEQVHEKPELKKLITKSQKATERFTKQFLTKIKQEESAKLNLKKIQTRLEELKAKRRKLAAKRAALKRRLKARKAKRRTARKAKRRTARKAKRKPARKAKRRTARKAKRKPARKAKRKPARKAKRRTARKAKRK